MPTARNDLAAAAVDGVLYAVGGKTGNNCTGLHTLEAYDPATNSWTTKAPMPTGRYSLSATALNGLLYVVGGGDQCAFQLGTVEAYDPATDTWTTKASMPTALASPTVEVVNGVLYVLGAYHGSAPVQAYDPVTNTWTTKAPMPMGRFDGIGGVVNGIIYIVASAESISDNPTDVEAYDPAIDTFTTMAPMPNDALVSLAAGGVVNGILYVVGGYGFAGQALSRVEAYDPVSNTWSAGSPMLTPRARPGIGVINGVLYAVGGGPDSPVLATLEAFTPANNTGPCDDGSACTTNDTCGGGTCNGGPPLNCDDGNDCTDDSCDPDSGCVSTNNTAPCDDGNECTTDDTCGDGTCNGGLPLTCDDGNVCTVDSCNPASGCANVPGNAGTVCRAGTGPCDVAESCTGSSATCPSQAPLQHTGILQPINADGSSTFKMGSTIPVKVKLTGPNQTCQNALIAVGVSKTSDLSIGGVDEASSTSGADTGFYMRYDATEGLYIYNLATKPLAPQGSGTWLLRLDFGDGELLNVLFALKR